MSDPIRRHPRNTTIYSIEVSYWKDDEIEVVIHDVGKWEVNRVAVARALRLAADKVERNTPMTVKLTN